ncbi:mechanosensitive ion channel family protein [Acinetobacter sichuanensis]|uniref:Small-conductance mechanosensitive channel n=1 Tax=Acinetobacter sichuanensis TaxID=2136183 RepID=A0A371YS33_9GAMM|nr:mechanosensitive ion channel family protein [Acinetobacter sichuanensis]RFC84279.1 mechanosensitive ion channel family protein [Acinetobacter sichuanensis]
MFDRLFNEFLDALKRSIYLSMGAPENHDLDWDVLAASVLSKLFIVVILIAFFWLLSRFLRLFVRYISKKFNTNQIITNIINNTIHFFWLLASVITILSQFGLSEKYLQAVSRAAIVSLIFYMIWMLFTKLTMRFLDRFYIDDSLKQLLRNIISVLLVIFGIAAIMAQFGFNIISIMAGLGIVGIAVSFAAQSTLSNFIAGITILIERPFHIGDWVRINKFEGKITQILLRTTHIRNRDNLLIIIPNSTVANAEVTNLTAHERMRFESYCRISLHEDIEKARQAILMRLDQEDEYLKTPAPSVDVREFAESGIVLIVRYWLEPYQMERLPRIQEKLLEHVKEALQDAKIEVPYPHLQLLPQPFSKQNKHE